MKLSLILLLSFSMALCSCSEKEHSNVVPVTDETPEALQDSKINLKSYSRSSADIIQALYTELVEQNPSLKQLEEDLTTYSSKPNDLKELFGNYNEKSLSYYASAHRTADMISDSTLKKRMAELISQSNERYLKKLSSTNELLKQLSENTLSLNDHYAALKIAVTMPVIEKYQSDKALTQKPFKDLIKEQEKLLKQADKLNPLF